MDTIRFLVTIYLTIASLVNISVAPLTAQEMPRLIMGELYCIEGDSEESGGIRFFSDGTVALGDPEVELIWGEYTIYGSYVTIAVDGEEETLEIVDEYTLKYDEWLFFVRDGTALNPANSTPFSIGSEPYVDENGETVLSYGTFPHMDGSSLLYPLAELLAIEIAGTADAVYFMDKDMAMWMFVEKEYDGYEGPIDWENDIYLEISQANLLLIANYKPEDKVYLESSGDRVESELIARDALVLICSEDNPVSNLTRDRARDIITGKILNWIKVGGEYLPIKTYSCLHSMPDLYAVIRSNLGTGGMLAEPMTEEHYIPNGVEDGPGYTVSYYASFENTPESFAITTYHEAKDMSGVKLLSIDGVTPTVESIKSGEYLLTFDCAAVYNAAEPVAENFAKWLTGAEASELIKKAGFIPIEQPQSLNEDSAMSLLCDVLNPTGTVVAYGPEKINGEDCWTFAIGTSTSEKFTAEDFYAVNQSGKIYRYDIPSGGEYVEYEP